MKKKHTHKKSLVEMPMPQLFVCVVHFSDFIDRHVYFLFHFIKIDCFSSSAKSLRAFSFIFCCTGFKTQVKFGQPSA